MSDLGDMLSAPSPLTVSAIRRLAARRGYRLRKLYGKDRYYLEHPTQGTVVADERCPDPDDCYFTKAEVVEFLKAEKPHD